MTVLWLGKSKGGMIMNKHDNQAYTEALNTHDPHNQYCWADNQLPWWVTPLKIIGFIAGGVGMFAVFALFTIVMFQLG
jgi:hypothetical protein